MYYGLLSLAAKVPAPSFTGILDTYTGAAAAYSAARRLSSSYTGALIRVRRSSDNTEQDIGYDGSNVLDESALTTFVGANNGFVVTLYDQSGNAKNATQSTASNQPQIVSSGSVLKENSIPTLTFDGSNDYLSISEFTVTTNNASYFVGKRTTSGKLFGSFTHTSGAYEFFMGQSNDNKYYYFYQNGNFLQSSSSYTTANYSLVDAYNDGTNKNIYVNSSVLSTSSAGLAITMKVNNIGSYQNSQFLTGNLQETIIWLSDQTANRTGINTNVNTFYSIYP